MVLCWLSLKRIAVAVIVINLILTILVFLIFWSETPHSILPKNIKHSNNINHASISEESSLQIDASSSLSSSVNYKREDGSHDKNTNEEAVEECFEEESSPVVEIWSKAAIGYYLWQHILQGSIDRNLQDGMYVYGSKKICNLTLKFRSGPSLTIEALRRFATSSSKKSEKKRKQSQDKNVLLVLNGRDEEKVETATSWLKEVTLLTNFLRQESNQSLRTGVVLLGNECCFNSWIKPFLASAGGSISFLFITYDWKLIDDSEVFQWPLGVATYRNFPVPETLPETVPQTMPQTLPQTMPQTLPQTMPQTLPQTIPQTMPQTLPSLMSSAITSTNDGLTMKNDLRNRDDVVVQVDSRPELNEDRPYVCNFLGSIYSNSSREEVLRVLSDINQKYTEGDKKQSPACLVKGRSSWTDSETRETRDVFIQALKSSDLTLSPIGMNHECYRIYEAMQMGSLPVLEERLSHVKGKKSSCDQSSAYRLLKRHGAPVLFVSNWTRELPSLIQRELQLSQQHKILRRKQLVSWYRDFKVKMRDTLLRVLHEKFFSPLS